jgi:two-component system KDP operon response regulator KdpE
MTRRTTILVADDDPALRQALTILLREEGYNVLQAVDGVECLHMAYDRHPDLVLLDIDMPNKDGREVCRQLRAASNVPIIMLTVYTSEREKVDRFDDGADDYVTKPFHGEELLARIRAVLRRARINDRTHQAPYEDGYLSVDFESHEVRINGERVPMSPKEWRLLEFLMKNPNRVIARQTLLKQVWGSEYVEEYNYLKVFIAHLRRKLNDPARRPRYIHTERHLGYRFQAYN